jgi:DUF2939 family protein
MSRKRSAFGPFAFLVLCFAAVWLYFTPYFAYRKIQKAAEAGDSQALAELVDFPALRESVKQGVRTAVAREIDDEKNPLARIGGMIAGAFASPVVDFVVSPEGIASLMKGRRPGDRDLDDDGENDFETPDLDVRRDYEGMDRFVVHLHEEDSGKERLALVMRREGIAGWKLAGIRLPEEEN